MSFQLPKGRALMLRTCDIDMCGHGGFAWPAAGLVEAPDWNPEPACGGGLHGLLWGDGDASQLKHEDATRRWLVCEVVESEVVQIRRKVKVPRAWVVYVGDRDGAIAMIQAHAPVGTPVVFAKATAGCAGTATAGDWGTATAGYAGTATAGCAGTATAGDWGTATAGDRGTATAGYAGTATAGDRGTATAGYAGTATAGYAGTATAGCAGTATAGDWGTATAGDWGTATAGDAGTATAGDWGTATAGDRGTATAGYAGTATAGCAGTATAGEGGTLSVRWWDGDASRYRIASADVGEREECKPGVAYVVRGGKLVRKDGQP